jgi:Spx/MgsR family transcriptional regulator
MEAKLYYTMSTRSLKQVRAYLEEQDVNYTSHSLSSATLTWEQLLEILMYTENGVEDILSVRSKDYFELIERGVNFDELTLTEFHELVTDRPRLIRTPILVAKNSTLIGYNEEEMNVLKNRKERKKMFGEFLEIFHMQDEMCGNIA